MFPGTGGRSMSAALALPTESQAQASHPAAGQGCRCHCCAVWRCFGNCWCVVHIVWQVGGRKDDDCNALLNALRCAVDVKHVQRHGGKVVQLGEKVTEVACPTCCDACGRNVFVGSVLLPPRQLVVLTDTSTCGACQRRRRLWPTSNWSRLS
jgi:hypothetical protein